MKNSKSLLKMIVLAMLIAIGVVISPILRVEGMCPMAHFINIVCSVFLGPWYSLLCATLIGIIRMVTIQTATTTILQEQTESSMQGRVFGLMGAMYSGFLPVGMAIFGPLADMLPLQWLMIGSGIALVFVTVYLQVKAKLNF